MKPTQDKEAMLTEDEKWEYYNDSGLAVDAHWMIDDLLKAQIAKLEKLGYFKRQCYDKN